MIKWVGSPHHSSREGHSVIGVVIHIMEGSLAGTDSWFQSKQSKVSAHYGVGPKGEVHQYVKEDRAAWHAGRVFQPSWPPALGLRKGLTPNHFTIGVEHHGYADTVWPEAELKASIDLVADICDRYNLLPTRHHIVGHREIYAKKSCPGNWLNLDAYVQAVASRFNQLRTSKLPVAAKNPVMPTIRRGSTGQFVALVQQILGVTGPDTFGPKTEAAVKQFQYVHGLTQDGVVGPATWAKLLAHQKVQRDRR